MTVPSDRTTESYAGTGSQTVFPYQFQIFADTDLTVRVIENATGSATLKTLTTHYTVSGVNDEDGGNVTFLTAPASGYTVDIRSNVPRTQPTAFTNLGRFLPESHEQAIDRIARQVQDLSRRVDLSVRFPDYGSPTGAELPAKATRASKYPVFDSSGNLTVAAGAIGTIALTQAAIGAAYDPQTADETTAGYAPTVWAPMKKIRLERYGAVGDDSTDNATAINKALAVAVAAGGGIIECDPGGKFKTSAKHQLPNRTFIDLNGSFLRQTGSNIGIIEVYDSGSVVQAGVVNGVLQYVTPQSAAQTNSIGLRLAVANRVNYTMLFRNLTIDGARKGVDCPYLSNCFAFGVTLEHIMVNGASDYGVDLQGDTATGGLTNIDLNWVWVLQTAGAEIAGSKGIRLVGINALGAKFLACDHIQSGPAVLAQLCRGRIDEASAESCDFANASGINGAFVLDGGEMEAGLLGSYANTVALSGTGSWSNLYTNNDVRGGADCLFDLNTALTNSGSGSYYTAQSDSTGLATFEIRSPRIGGTTPAEAYLDTYGSFSRIGNWRRTIRSGARRTVTYSASMTINASQGASFEITATNGTAFTVEAPTNPKEGQAITVVIRNAAGGALGVATWNAIFKMAAWTQPANGFSRAIIFEYNGTNWVERARATADVPN